MTVFSDRSGKTRRLLLERVRGRLGSLSGLDMLESIGFPVPDREFRQMLSPLPPGYILGHGFFHWRWTSDGKYLTADNSEQIFEMTAAEARLLDRELIPENEDVAEGER